MNVMYRKQCHRLKIVPMMLLALIMFFTTFIGTTSIVFAADSTINIKIPSADQASVKEVVDKLNGVDSSGKTSQSLVLEYKTTEKTPADNKLLKYSNNAIVFNLEGFQKATDKSRKRALDNFVNQLQNSTVSKQTQQNVFDTMSESDNDVSRLLVPLLMNSTRANLFSAMRILNPFLGVVQTLFGIGAFIIVIALAASTIIDLVFIGLPLAREKFVSQGEKKGGKIPFVSADALSVVKETESSVDSSGGYKNPYVTYFGRRVFTYIILAVCLLYLVMGQIGDLIAWLLTLGSGFVG
ncbi:hypothetical protein D3C81_10410 [compost metagenome]